MSVQENYQKVWKLLHITLLKYMHRCGSKSNPNHPVKMVEDIYDTQFIYRNISLKSKKTLLFQYFSETHTSVNILLGIITDSRVKSSSNFEDQ